MLVESQGGIAPPTKRIIHNFANFAKEVGSPSAVDRTVVSPHSQGLQGSHLNLSQTSAQRDKRYFLLNNKAVLCVYVNGARRRPHRPAVILGLLTCSSLGLFPQEQL